MPSIDDLCASVAAYGLPGAIMDLPTESMDRPSWHYLRGAARAHRIDGLLAAAVSGRALATTEAQKAAVMDSHSGTMGACLMLEAALLDLKAAMDRTGIQVAVLRGAATAHLDYPSPAWRPFGDIDLLVPAGMINKAAVALTASGFRPAAPPVAAGRWEAPGLAFTARHGLEIDLYEHVIAGPLVSTLLPGELWRNLSTFELAGTPVSALAPEARLIAACLRVAVGPAPRLIGMRDVVQLVLGGQVPISDLHRAAREWGVRALVASAVRQAWQSFALADVVALSTWARRYRPTAEEVALVEAYREPSPVHKTRRRLSRRLLPSSAARAHKTRGVLLP
jgi:hypothetical protein